MFEIPESYHVQDNGRNVHLQDEDYEIMQFAIQQSLLESSRSQVHVSEPMAGLGRFYPPVWPESLVLNDKFGIFVVFT